MAKVNNLLLQGASGRCGDLLYRTTSSGTFVSPMPKKSKTRSAKQRASANKFADGAKLVQQALANDPQLKARYQAKAKKLKLNGAYTAAIRDYMRGIFSTG